MVTKKNIIIAILMLLPLFTGDPIIIFTWVIGLAVGCVLQKSRFCFAAAIRDYYLFGSTSLLKTLIYLLIFTLIGFFAIQVFSSGDGLPPGLFKPIGLNTALGGLFFGLGMTLGGGCMAITLVRLGEGFYVYFITLLASIIGVFLAIASFDLWKHFLINMPTVYLGDYMGKVSAVVLSLSILFAVLCIIVRKERSFGDLPEYVAATSDSSNFWTSIRTALYLAILNTALLTIMKQPIQISHELTHWVSKTIQLFGYQPKNFTFFSLFKENFFATPFLNWETFLLFGIILGSFSAATISREFRPKPIRSLKQVIMASIGGLLMGFGARLAMGCTVGNLVGGIASMSLHGWLFALFLPLGVYAGTKILEKTI